MSYAEELFSIFLKVAQEQTHYLGPHFMDFFRFYSKLLVNKTFILESWINYEKQVIIDLNESMHYILM